MDVSEEELDETMSKSPLTSCALDLLDPTTNLEQFQSSLLPVITNVVNSSLRKAVFPQEMKHAIMSPLIKKLSLDPNILKKQSNL